MSRFVFPSLSSCFLFTNEILLETAEEKTHCTLLHLLADHLVLKVPVLDHLVMKVPVLDHLVMKVPVLDHLVLKVPV